MVEVPEHLPCLVTVLLFLFRGSSGRSAIGDDHAGSVADANAVVLTDLSERLVVLYSISGFMKRNDIRHGMIYSRLYLFLLSAHRTCLRVL